MQFPIQAAEQRETLGPVRNRKTAQNFNQNRKTPIKIDQNRTTADNNDHNQEKGRRVDAMPEN